MSYRDIEEALLVAYDKPGPRYTSYPTAPVWTDDFGVSDWKAALARANDDRDSPLSLYVHLPFCESMCFYCACNVIITQRREKSVAYVDLVLREAELLANELPDRRDVYQHHWGGGTPTYLEPAECARLYRGLCEHFPARPGAETSVEVDPRVTTAEHLGVLRELGFNRISMGVQDFDPRVQETIHRVQSREETKALVDEARRLGFESVNVDLVYGLPHQRVESFDETLATIVAWGVDRVACYSFAWVPWLKKHQRAIPEESLPAREIKFALFRQALVRFADAGYVAIGLDHFARPGDPLATAADSGRLHRNFMGYTTRMRGGRQPEDMLPLGVTSIGEAGGAFGQNAKERGAWGAAIERGELPVRRGHLRSADDAERRRIILDIMCAFRLRYADYDRAGAPPFEERYAGALAALPDFVADGLVELEDRGFRVTDKGRIFLRNIAMRFDAYLPGQQKGEGKMFSRTV